DDGRIPLLVYQRARTLVPTRDGDRSERTSRYGERLFGTHLARSDNLLGNPLFDALFAEARLPRFPGAQRPRDKDPSRGIPIGDGPGDLLRRESAISGPVVDPSGPRLHDVMLHAVDFLNVVNRPDERHRAV